MGIGKSSTGRRNKKHSSHRNPYSFDLPKRPQTIAVVGQGEQRRLVTRSYGEALKKQGVEVKFAKLTFTDSKRHGSMLSMRTKDDLSGNSATSNQARVDATLVTPLDKKAYKKGATRIHWKGERDPNTGKTTGLTPFITQRDGQGWSTEHEQARSNLSDALMKRPGFTPLDNGTARWGAENSHLVAGSLWAPNDAVSAPAASVHQNTEWLAMEEGLKSLSKRKDLGGELRFKTTGYVHESGEHKGTLKAARFKIYIGGNKVFDHLTDGQRGNIDKTEAEALKSRVTGLSSLSPAINPRHSKHSLGLFGPSSPKGVVGNAPTLDQVKGNTGSRLSSELSPMFTGTKDSAGNVRNKSESVTHVNSLLK